MQTWEETRQVLTQHFLNGWGDFCETFLEGAEEPDLSNRTDPYVLFTLEPGRIEQLGMLGRTPPKRSYGTVEVTIGVPKSLGMSWRAQFADKIAELFVAQAVEDVILQGAFILSVVDGKDWRSQTALIDFYFEQTTGA